MTRPIMADLVEETTTTDGTGDFVLAGAKANRQAFSVLGATAAEVTYRVDFGSEWAIYKGSYTDATKTLSRDEVESSSNGGSEVSFSAGVKSVLLVATANFLNRLAGHGIPSPAGDAATPGVSIGEDGSGVFYVDGAPAGSKALCISIDTNNNARFYHAADRKAFSLGWAFASALPGYIAPAHDYAGAVAHLYDSTQAHVVLQSATVGLVMSSFSGGGNTYRIQTSGSSFTLSKLVTSTGLVDKSILSTTGERLTVGTTAGVEAANLAYSNSTNAQVGFNAGDNLAGGLAFYDVACGYLSLTTAVAPTYCTASGAHAMQYSAGVTENSFNLTKITMSGALAGRYHHGADSVGMGFRAVGGLSSSTNSTGARHVGVGSDALNQLTTGVEDTCLGFATGNQLTTGSGVVYVGCRAGEHLGNVSDKLVIGNGPTAGDCLILGDFDAGTLTLQADVTISSSLTINDYKLAPADGTAGQVQVTDGAGQMSWVDRLVPVGRTGLRLSRISTTQIQVAKGSIHNHDESKRLKLTSATTLDLTVSGDFVNSSSRDVDEWYHVLIGTETSSGDVVVALSTTLAMPAGWDDWQRIGGVPTNTTGSGEWVLFEQHGNEFIAVEEIISYSNTTPGTSELTIRAWCPPGNYPVTCQLRNWGGNASAYIVLRRAAGGAAVDAGYIQASTPMNWPARCTTDASGNIYLIIGTAITFSEFRVHGKSYTYPIGEAGAV